MSATTTKIPHSACMLEVGMHLVQAEDGQAPEKGRLFRGKANSGAVIKHWRFGNFAIDMESLQIPRQDIPLLRDHDARQIVGYTTSIKASKDGIDVEGRILDATPAGAEVLALLEAGMPLQMSVYVPPGVVLQVNEGESVHVNGRKLTGRGAVFQKAALREATITAMGMDQNTRAAVLSGRHGDVEVELGHGEGTLSEQQNDAAAGTPQPVTAASLAASHPDVVAALQAGAITAERQRIATIQGMSKGVSPELLSQAITEGWDVGKTASAFLKHVQDNPPKAEAPVDPKAKRLSELRDASSPERLSNGQDDPDTYTSGGDKGTKLSDMPEGEEKWKAEFAADKAIRDEFMTEANYLAFKAHPQSRRQLRAVKE